VMFRMVFASAKWVNAWVVGQFEIIGLGDSKPTS
jgi:hypothetical protein